MSRLDEILPRWHERERHRVPLPVPPERALEAARSVTLAEMPAVRALFRMRGLGLAPPDAPLLDGLLALGFRLLAESERELVVGLVGRPWRLRGDLRRDADFAAFDEPGYAKMAMSIEADGAELRTETRVWLTNASARRRFRAYWLLVRPFSGLVRRGWLRAAQRRIRHESGTHA